MSYASPTKTITIGTMRRWKSGMEQLGAEGDLELLRLVAEQRQRQEEGDATNTLTDEQFGLIEGFTGIKAEYQDGGSFCVSWMSSASNPTQYRYGSTRGDASVARVSNDARANRKRRPREKDPSYHD